MYPFPLLLVDILCAIIIVLGLLTCGISGFYTSHRPLSERQRIVGVGVALVVLGIFGFIWKVPVLLYSVLVLIAIFCFACVGVYRVFKSSTQTPD
jgi:multisubunit Na+/H+ antiporter MnhG subunit